MPLEEIARKDTHTRKLRQPKQVTGAKMLSLDSVSPSMLRWNSRISLNITTLTGKSFGVDVSSESTISELKELISEQESIPMHSIVLVFCERVLKYDFYTIGEYGIVHGSNLKLVLQMKGGSALPSYFDRAGSASIYKKCHSRR